MDKTKYTGKNRKKWERSSANVTLQHEAVNHTKVKTPDCAEDKNHMLSTSPVVEQDDNYNTQGVTQHPLGIFAKQERNKVLDFQ